MAYYVDPEEQARRDAWAAQLNPVAFQPGAQQRGANEAGYMRTQLGDLPTSGFSPEENAAKVWADALPGGKPPRSMDAPTQGAAPPLLPEDPVRRRQLRLITEARKAGMDDDSIKEVLRLDAEKRKKENTYDPLEGMPTGTKFAVGMGQRAYEMYNRGRQLLGVEGAQADIDERKQLDKPLQSDPWATAGGIATDIGALAIPGGAAAKVAGKIIPNARAFLPGLGLSAAGGAAQSGLTEPIATGETLDEKLLAGALGGAAGRVVAGGVKHVITPNRGTSSQRTKAAELLESEGVPVSAGQGTNNPTVQAFETAAKDIPVVRGTMIAGSPRQTDAYTRAVAKKIGVTDDILTDEALAKARDEIGKTFERVGNANPRRLSPQYHSDLQTIIQETADEARQHGRSSLPAKEDIAQAVRRSQDPLALTGSAYNSLRSSMTTDLRNLYRSTEADSAGKIKVLERLRDALDDEAQRMWGTHSPMASGGAALTSGVKGAPGAPAAALPDAWEKWAILKQLERPGVIKEGMIDPSRLSRNVPTAQRDTTAFNRLASAGSILGPGANNSGTSRNWMLANALLRPAAALGFLGWEDPQNAMAAGGGMAALAALSGTKAGSKYFRNTLMNENPAIARALRQWGTIAGADLANND